MANIKSSKKRILVNAKANAANTAKRTFVRNVIKKYEAALVAKDVETATTMLPVVISAIDKAKSDGIYTANSAARKIASFSKRLDALKVA